MQLHYAIALLILREGYEWCNDTLQTEPHVNWIIKLVFVKIYSAKKPNVKKTKLILNLWRRCRWQQPSGRGRSCKFLWHLHNSVAALFPAGHNQDSWAALLCESKEGASHCCCQMESLQLSNYRCFSLPLVSERLEEQDDDSNRQPVEMRSWS